MSLLSIVVLAIGLAGCGSGAAPPSAGGTVDAAGDWQLTSGVVDEAPFPTVPDAQITLTVNGSQISGRSACNHYGGEIVVDGGRVRFSPGAMTEMACAEPAMTAEAAFHSALGRITGATRDGDRLVLSGPGVELTFDRPAAASPA